MQSQLFTPCVQVCMLLAHSVHTCHTHCLVQVWATDEVSSPPPLPLPVAQHCAMYSHTVAATPRLFGAEGAGVSGGAAAAGAAAGKGKKTERESAAEREAKEGAKAIQQQVRGLVGEEGKVEASSGSGLSNGGRRRDNAAVHGWLLEGWELAPAVSLQLHQHNTQHMHGYAVPAVSLQTCSLPGRSPCRLPERTSFCQTSSLLSSHISPGPGPPLPCPGQMGNNASSNVCGCGCYVTSVVHPRKRHNLEIARLGRYAAAPRGAVNYRR